MSFFKKKKSKIRCPGSETEPTKAAETWTTVQLPPAEDDLAEGSHGWGRTSSPQEQPGSCCSGQRSGHAIGLQKASSYSSKAAHILPTACCFLLAAFSAQHHESILPLRRVLHFGWHVIAATPPSCQNNRRFPGKRRFLNGPCVAKGELVAVKILLWEKKKKKEAKKILRSLGVSFSWFTVEGGN